MAFVEVKTVLTRTPTSVLAQPTTRRLWLEADESTDIVTVFSVKVNDKNPQRERKKGHKNQKLTQKYLILLTIISLSVSV